MSIDWTKLRPHLPLGVGDTRHVARPSGDGERLASMLRAGFTSIAVAGPVGSGKSTEIATAAKALQGDRVACLVLLDRLTDMRSCDEREVYLFTAARLARLAVAVLHIELDPSTLKGLSYYGFEGPDFAGPALAQPGSNERDLLIALIREVARKSQQGRVALLVDGLEKSPEPVARGALMALSSVKQDADLVVVVPPALVTGPDSHDVLAEYRIFAIRPVPVVDEPGAPWKESRAFLRAVLERRLGHTASAEEPLGWLIDRAAEASGGIPRTFLLLLQDCAGYAALSGRAIPTESDLEIAVRDHRDSMARLLRDGDVAVLYVAHGTNGLEVPLERKVRFLTQGLLLEYDFGPEVQVFVHPLLSTLIHP